MNHNDYEKAKKALSEAEWKLQKLTGNESFTHNTKLHIEFLKAIIFKYEDCYHVNKPFIKHVEIYTEVLK